MRHLPVVDSVPRPSERDGWTFRFLVSENRREEMTGLYRRLGFDVTTERAEPDPSGAACDVCLESGPVQWAIYTRRPEASGEQQQGKD